MFNGFKQPKENWSKLPNELIDALSIIETIGELKVILYILRHTWGYHDSEKKITLDEFQHGRKYSDGSRIDSGTGLSRPTILSGIEKAVEHGFINVEVDSSDKARVKKLYSLKNQGLKDFTPGVKKLYIGGKETLHRTEKETLEKKNKKDKNSDDGFSDAVTAYENGIAPINHSAGEFIAEAVDEFGAKWVIEAIEIAVKSNVRKWRYVEGILGKWRVHGRQEITKDTIVKDETGGMYA